MMDPATPKKLGPYIIEGLIGKGGMGTVYRGTDPETAESAAIKVLAPHLAPDQTFLNRFEEEVETLLELSHPNIVQLVSFGKQEEHFFFAMELVNGESLQAKLKSGKVFGWAETIEVVMDVCAGLHHSHNLGIIHRDIKPGNIILAEDGKVKVADFGIAKRFNANHATQYGVVGTAEFMSPEQAKGQTATIQSDLYSLGAVMFMMLSGRPPIEGSTPQDTLKMVVTQSAPPLASRAPSVPEQLAKIVDRLLQKDPVKRFRSAKSVEAKLEDLLDALKSGAEHETAVVPVPESFSGSGNFPDSSHSEVPEPTMAQSGQATFLDNPHFSGSRSRPTDPLDVESGTGSNEYSSAKTESVFANSSNEGKVIREKDFFQRAVPGEFERETEESSSKLITAILAVGFVLVFSVSAFLVWNNVLRAKTADEVWAVIEVSESKPQFVMDELEDFIERFPGDSRQTKADQLKRLGEARQLRNRLAIKQASGARLTPIERNFLKYSKAPDQNIQGYREQINGLDALLTFIRLQQNKDDDSKQIYRCLSAAKTYRSIFDDEYQEIIKENKNTIIEMIRNADALELSDPKRARTVRQNLINMFGNDPETEDLIQKVRKKLGIKEKKDLGPG